MNKKVEGKVRRNLQSNSIDVDSFIHKTSTFDTFSKRWIAIIVQMNTEKSVATKLGKFGIDNYVPIQKEVYQCENHKQTTEHADFHKPTTYLGLKELATLILNEQIEKLRFLVEKVERTCHYELSSIPSR